MICTNDSVLLTISYPVAGMQHTWIDGSTSPTFWAVGTGSYWVEATDACGNISSDTIDVTEAYPEVLSTISHTDANCFGGNDGSASVTVTQGSAPFSYLWSNNSNSINNNNLTAGTYEVTITDQNNCNGVNEVTISEPSEIVLVPISVDSAECHRTATGAATISATGGVGNYAYQWSTVPVQNSSTATNLLGGISYTVSITDANQCVNTGTVYIPSPPQMIVAASSDGTICHGAADATATLSVSGGTPSYSYLWDNNAQSQTTEVVNNLATGTYSVTVSDNNGCAETTSITVTEAAPLDFQFSTQPPLCFGQNNGSIDVALGNGQLPYQFSWSTGIQGEQIQNLTIGNYTVTVTDGNGCIEFDSIFLSQPNALQLEVDVTDLSCFQSKDGQISIRAIAGSPPYEYSIDGSTFTSSNIIYGLTAGTYPIIIRDANGCKELDNLELNEPDEFVIDAGEDFYIQQGDSVQLSLLSATRSVDSISLIWEEQFIRNSLSCSDCEMPWATPLEDIYYSVFAEDEKGCVAEDGLWIYVEANNRIFPPNAFSPNNDNINDVFIIHGEPGTQVNFFRIYDRWGELVFESSDFEVNDINFGWDGYFHGELMDTAVFGWFTEVVFPDGTVKQFKGNVTLLR